MAIRINRGLLGFVFFFTLSFYGIERDSIIIDPRWNSWHVESVSRNGDWALVYQVFPNDRKKNKGFAVNTDTRQRVEVTGLGSSIFTDTDQTIGTEAGQTVVVDLKTGCKTTLGKMAQRDWIAEQQLLSYRNDANEWRLQQYTTKGAKTLWHAEGISNYWMSPSHKGAVFQKKDSSTLYALDFKSWKEIKLGDWNSKVRSISWNESGSHCVLRLEDALLWMDVEQGLQRKIAVPESALPQDLKVSFFPNQTVYLSYTRLDTIGDATSNLVEIWNSSDRVLKNKMRPRPKGDRKAFVYTPDNQKLKELPRSLKQDYLNIGINDYLLVYEPLEYEHYLQAVPKVRYRLLNLKSGKEEGNLTTAYNFEHRYQKASKGDYLVYPKLEGWEIYDFTSRKRVAIPHKEERSSPIWSADGQQLWYQDGENVWAYDLKKEQHFKITKLQGSRRFGWVHTKKSITSSSRTVDLNHPFWFYSSSNDHQTTYYKWNKGRLETVIEPTDKRLNTIYLAQAIAQDGQTAVWTEEHYNQAPTVQLFRKGKIKTLVEPEVPQELYAYQKQKVIEYQDEHGVALTGILWYPKNFSANQKYPMVTQIYERMRYLQNEFKISSLFNSDGFNRALLTQQGYFVFQPDTYVSGEGAGLSALRCVTKGIEEITNLEPAIDKTKVGLMGHSFGSYETSFILGHSDLFAAGISGSGVHDLINFYYDYSDNTQLPNYLRVEGPQIDLRMSFAENPTKYYKNSPIHFAQNYETPLLLWTGLEDTNILWKQTRAMHTALVRYSKPAIALFYPSEGHIIKQASNQEDLTKRLLEWFEYYLKNQKVEWIANEVDSRTY